MEQQRDGPQKQPSLLARAAQAAVRFDAKVAEKVRAQPSLAGEAAGLWRGGRDDFVRVMLGMDMAAAPGAPDQPTQALITESLTNRPVDARNDVIELTPAPTPEPGQHQEQSRGRSR